jgi:hypothetical protein
VTDEIRELRDRLEVVELVSRYAHALDRRQWDEFHSIFHDEIEFLVPHVPADAPAVSRDEFVKMVVDTVGGFEATHHPISNHVVTIDGDRAGCKCYAQAYHTVPTERGIEDYCVVRGFYDWGFRRTANGWRIDRMKVEFHGPVEGYMGVYGVAAERAKALAAEGE